MEEKRKVKKVLTFDSEAYFIGKREGEKKILSDSKLYDLEILVFTFEDGSMKINAEIEVYSGRRIDLTYKDFAELTKDFCTVKLNQV